MTNFRHRGYSEDCLQSCIDKLQKLNRSDLLKPKSQWLLINLRKFHPELIPEGIQIVSMQKCNLTSASQKKKTTSWFHTIQI